jgi:hypothetical protein
MPNSTLQSHPGPGGPHCKPVGSAFAGSNPAPTIAVHRISVWGTCPECAPSPGVGWLSRISARSINSGVLRAVGVVLLALLLVLPPTASASDVIGTATQQRVGLPISMTGPAGYQHRMPQPPQLVVHAYLNPACDGYPCADPIGGEIWVGRHARRFDVSHEIGHVWWERVATEVDRSRATRRLGLPADAPWYGDLASYKSRAPIAGEMAADAYAACDLGYGLQRRGEPGTWETGYGYTPTRRKHRVMCATIRGIGAR